MARKRGKAPPPARRGFTVADQVNQLVSASEADPDRGFMARTMALCSLPRSNPGTCLQYKRVNGPFTLYMVAGGGNKLLRQPAASPTCLGLNRSGADPKPRDGPVVFRVQPNPDEHSHDAIQNFRRRVLRELKKIKLAWPGLNYATGRGLLILYPS